MDRMAGLYIFLLLVVLLCKDYATGVFVHTGHEAIPADSVLNPAYNAAGLGSPIYKYRRGHMGRIEFVEGIIRQANLHGGTPCNVATRSFTQRMSMGGARDVCGHIIANRLGGSGHVEYNVFPQHSTLNNGNWKSFEARVAAFLDVPGTDRVANIRIWFDYVNNVGTRPTQFTVTYNLLEGDDILQNNSFRVINNGDGGI